MTLTVIDGAHLRRCVELARRAVDAGDQPFGSLLVGPVPEQAEELRRLHLRRFLAPVDP